MTAGINKASTRPYRRQADRRPLFAVAAGLLLAVLPGRAAEAPNAPWPWPVPVDPPQITATFMEGRTGGYHTGLDIRTMGRTGLPVATPLAGSVVRIRVSPEGYGKALYLDVGGGRSLVFAHLSAFADPIQALVTARQASSRQYAQQIYLEPGELTFAAGDVVALSGDTGTGAPHLHFEVRDGDVPINPIDFFEVPDTRAPVILGVQSIPLDARGWPERLRAARDARGDELEFEGSPIGIRVGVEERTGINAFRLMPRRVQLRVGEQVYTFAQDDVAFDQRWQRGLEVDRDADGTRWISLFRRPDLSHRGTASGWDGRIVPTAGTTIEVVVEDHRGRSATRRLELVPADVSDAPDVLFPTAIGASRDPGPHAFVGGRVRILGPTTTAFSSDTLLWIDPVETDAPAAHDGLGPAFEVVAPGVAFRRGVDVSVDVPGPAAEYTLNARDRRGRWSPESGVRPDPDRPQAVRTRLVDTGIYRVVRDVTAPAVGPWRVHDEPVRGEVTLRARENVQHGVTLPRWPALRLDVTDAIAGIEPEGVRVFVDDEPYPARPELEDDHVWIEWDVDPGPGAYAVRVEVADRLGHVAASRLTVRLVE